MDPNSRLLMWSLMMTTQAERSRMAEKQHIRAEQVRRARTRPTAMSAVGRVWTTFTQTRRSSVEPTTPAAQL